MNIKYFLIWIFFSGLLSAQSYISKDGIPRDSSYTVYGYYQKELKNFPFIKIAKPDTSKLKAVFDITYKSIGDRKLKLDLFYSDSVSSKMPIIILIHGGGWRSGDKTFQHPLATAIAVNGYLCATIEYRLSPEAKFPAAVYDIKSVVKWIKQNAELYNGDPEKVILLGCSSGGHLAALCGITGDSFLVEQDASINKISSSINLVIDIDGILDFTHPAESGKDTSDQYPSVGKLWLGSSYKDDPALWQKASPLNYISKDCPEFLFINSSIERFHAGRDEACKIFEKYGISYKIMAFQDSPHTFWLFNPWFEQTVNYIVNHLKSVF